MSRIMSCIPLLHSLQFNRLLSGEETIHLRRSVLSVRIVKDVVSRFHAGGFAPRDFHSHALIDSGKAHIAHCRPAEVMKEQRRNSGRFAGFAPSGQLRTHGLRVMEEYPLATFRASLAATLSNPPFRRKRATRAPFCLWSGTPAAGYTSPRNPPD